MRFSAGEACAPRSLPCRYSGRTDAGSLYELTVRLLSEHEDVLAEFNTGQLAVPEDGSWMEVSRLGRGGGAGTSGAELVETQSLELGSRAGGPRLVKPVQVEPTIRAGVGVPRPSWTAGTALDA